MPKPTDDELKHALDVAARMRDTGRDSHHIAKSLLSLHYLNGFLEKIRHAADLYIRFGQGETEHRELLRALEAYRSAEERSRGGEHTEFGLE